MNGRKEQLETHLQDLLKQGSVSAFNAVYSLYARKLLVYVSAATKNKEDAEEIVHDIFMALWNNREKLDSSKSLSSLLFSLAYRRRIDFFRQMMRLPIYEDYRHWQDELATEDHSDIEYRDFCRIFTKALETLREKPRRVITLSRLHGLSNKEISVRLGISEKTVRNINSEALKTLNETLKRMLENQ